MSKEGKATEGLKELQRKELRVYIINQNKGKIMKDFLSQKVGEKKKKNLRHRVR